LVPLTGGIPSTKEESMQNDKSDTKDRPLHEQDQPRRDDQNRPRDERDRPRDERDRPRNEQDRVRSEQVGKSHEDKSHDDKPKKPASEQATHQGGGGVNKDHKPHGPGADR
jgi:hypothetical protein